ncbi:hypothetical protein FCK90_09425 [Kocuria coralli]|uniref:Polysaccharide biosynthesis enzyme WcbI domain-containing protein n=1 Tax=Kocuria coralli TaxID=1461025 RepID=A0A5J5KX76_9MICC|nr:WcbI family polysaccharide biosynthesis putative acetyltransferase [Kocuria coralli]KAA9393880.1 hypothetical protein FCK90_09425 [Kocuria coralli]
MEERARRHHYRDFYAFRTGRGHPTGHNLSGGGAATDLPLLVVIGNCQAESLRVLLECSAAVRSIRVPPVFEWTNEDVAVAHRLLRRVDVLIVQPIRNDYRSLACGTEQLEALLAPGATSIRGPVLRFAGLHPFQVIARDPVNPSCDPPLVPYHDLRALVAAHRGQLRREEGPDFSGIDESSVDLLALRAAAKESVDQLRYRETAHGTIRMTDVLERYPHWHTINHPDNSTLTILVERVLETFLGGSRAGSPGRELLRSIEAPVQSELARRLDVTLRPDATDQWRLGYGPDARCIPHSEVVDAHLDYYRHRPELVSSAMRRYKERIELLGLAP